MPCRIYKSCGKRIIYHIKNTLKLRKLMQIHGHIVRLRIHAYRCGINQYFRISYALGIIPVFIFFYGEYFYIFTCQRFLCLLRITGQNINRRNLLLLKHIDCGFAGTAGSQNYGAFTVCKFFFPDSLTKGFVNQCR